MRKPLLAVALFCGGLMLAGASVSWSLPIPNARQPAQQSQQQETKSVAGTVASIGNGGRSFALEVNQPGNKETMQFVLDKDSHVEGQVKVGTAVTVEYVAMADQNVAKTVTAQG